jgi:Spy/CpxP family protein refolding chaperone
MKLRTLTLIAGAIALALTAAPYSAHAQAHNSSPLLIAQKGDSDGGLWKQLNLSDKQKRQIHDEREKVRQKFNIPPGKIDFKSLTPDQRKKVKEAHQEADKYIYEHVLTKEQRQQVDTYRNNHPHRQGHHQNNQ